MTHHHREDSLFLDLCLCIQKLQDICLGAIADQSRGDFAALHQHQSGDADDTELLCQLHFFTLLIFISQ